MRFNLPSIVRKNFSDSPQPREATREEICRMGLLLEKEQEQTYQGVNSTLKKYTPDDSPGTKYFTVDGHSLTGLSRIDSRLLNGYMVGDVWTDPEYRGRGYGGRAIDACIKYWDTHYDDGPLLLIVYKKNELAISIYKKKGFCNLGEFDVRGKPVLLMQYIPEKKDRYFYMYEYPNGRMYYDDRYVNADLMKQNPVVFYQYKIDDGNNGLSSRQMNLEQFGDWGCRLAYVGPNVVAYIAWDFAERMHRHVRSGSSGERQ